MKHSTNTSSFWSRMTMTAVLLTVGFGAAFAQGFWPDYDFRAVNPDGDTLYYRITSSTAPYTVAVTRCHDSVYHTLPWPQNATQVGQPGFLYPVYDYDSLITIPSTVAYNGTTYTVTSIDKEAFFMQKDLHTVIIPASVETIDTGAFCASSLHNIVMPNVKRINYYAFANTPSLTHIDLPSCLTYLGDEAFSYSAISEVDVPAGVTVLPYQSFYRCPLTKITLHEGLEEILEDAVPPTYLDTIVFPGTLRKLALGNPYLINPYDPTSDILCHYVEFKPNTNPLELYDFCFYGFRHLTSIALPVNTVKLGDYCFALSGLEEIVIPASIDTIPEYCFAECGALSHVVLPQQLVSIGTRAFSQTPLLKEIDIPATVTYIGKRAFIGNNGESGLEIINCYGEMPPVISGSGLQPTFSTSDTIYVRVPCGKTAAYQSASGWSSYSNFIYEECVGIDDREPTEFKVYPNPADEVLYVELNGAGIKSVGLYDLQGRVITGVCNTPQPSIAAINVRNVPAGVYVLRVTDEDGKEYHRKVVVR